MLVHYFVLSSFAIFLKRKREMVAFYIIVFLVARGCGVVGWVSLQCVIVVIPDHAHLLFYHAFTLSPLNDVSIVGFS